MGFFSYLSFRQCDKRERSGRFFSPAKPIYEEQGCSSVAIAGCVSDTRIHLNDRQLFICERWALSLLEQDNAHKIDLNSRLRYQCFLSLL